jgi:hypothetical protein
MTTRDITQTSFTRLDRGLDRVVIGSVRAAKLRATMVAGVRSQHACNRMNLERLAKLKIQVDYGMAFVGPSCLRRAGWAPRPMAVLSVPRSRLWPFRLSVEAGTGGARALMTWATVRHQWPWCRLGAGGLSTVPAGWRVPGVQEDRPRGSGGRILPVRSARIGAAVRDGHGDTVAGAAMAASSDRRRCDGP